MIYIPVTEYCVAAKDAYIPVPCKGIVVGFRGAFSEDVAADDTVNLQRGANSVNLITVGADNTSEGVELTGVRDSTYKELIFDPESSTEANKKIKISISALETNPTTFHGIIEFDELALTTQ